MFFTYLRRELRQRLRQILLVAFALGTQHPLHRKPSRICRQVHLRDHHLLERYLRLRIRLGYRRISWFLT